MTNFIPKNSRFPYQSYIVLRGATWQRTRLKAPLKGPLYDRESLNFAKFRANWEFALRVWQKFQKNVKVFMGIQTHTPLITKSRPKPLGHPAVLVFSQE